MNKFLIIQTAFLGDVILATSIVEKLHQALPDSKIDFLLRKGNESLLKNHPIINEVIVWNKHDKKYDSLKRITKQVHQQKYDVVINLQRFASSGLITAFSGAKLKIGFAKNPLSFSFIQKFPHNIGDGTHEIERNHQLIKAFTDNTPAMPRLYPSNNDYLTVEDYKKQKYVCMAPTSVWFTKQLPKEKWAELINAISDKYQIYLLGSPTDAVACEEIKTLANNKQVVNLAGKLSLLASAALMQNAQMNYVNDSAPLHIASAMNAPTTAFFCSTTPDFGFGPLVKNANIVEVKEKLNCRPCGLHGKKVCPEGHFKCGYAIAIDNI